jgi:uncharacterized membrane protein
MAAIETVVAVGHLLVGALWTGSVVFVAGAVLPAAREGDLNAAPLESLVGSLTAWSRGASVLMLLTGGHLAATRYEAAALTGTQRGWLVLAMVALWLALTALVEIGAGRMDDGLERRKVREPTREALPWFRAAAAVGLLLLIDAGILLG